jgi:hypothetical protein
MERVHERFAAIKVLDRNWLDLTTLIGKGILAFLSILAELPRLHDKTGSSMRYKVTRLFPGVAGEKY